jgi:2-oxoglutarate ferredoxin oxidoreductase subunit alpha
MWTLGLALWMFDRDRAPIEQWLKTKFAKMPELAEANIAALNAGHAYGETAEIGGQLHQHHIDPRRPSRASTAPSPAPRRSRSAWSRALSLPGCRCSSAAIRSRRPARSSTTSPASRNMGHDLPGEDEIAAIGSAIGASFAGSLGVTSSSGPGIALKAKRWGLRS